MTIILSEADLTKVLNQYIESKYNVHVWRKLLPQLSTDGEGFDIQYKFTAYCDDLSKIDVIFNDDYGDVRANGNDPNGLG